MSVICKQTNSLYKLKPVLSWSAVVLVSYKYQTGIIVHIIFRELHLDITVIIT